MDLPWYFVPGNVDNRLECRNRLFTPDPGVALFNYTWKAQGIRFLSLDWGAHETNRYTLDPQSYNWLKQQLDQRCPTIILTHHPPVSVGIPMFDEMTPPDLNRLHELIAGSPVLAIFHGHTHHPWENRIDGIPVFGTGSVTYRRCLHHDYAQGLVLEIHPPQYRVVTIHSDGSVTAPIHEVPLGP
jgi:3',5'-cyclic AMP phosphodiesterase CpdA